MARISVQSTVPRDIGIGLVISLLLLVWFKFSPPLTGESTSVNRIEVSTNLKEIQKQLTETKYLLKQEQARKLSIEEKLRESEQHLKSVQANLFTSKNKAKTLEASLANKDTDLKILKNSYQMRLEELSHMMNAIKLHKTIDYSVINRAEKALNTAN